LLNGLFVRFDMELCMRTGDALCVANIMLNDGLRVRAVMSVVAYRLQWVGQGALGMNCVDALCLFRQSHICSSCLNGPISRKHDEIIANQTLELSYVL
jgi:hypothetical protein